MAVPAGAGTGRARSPSSPSLAERENIETEITGIDNTPARDDHAELLDAIPLLAGDLGQLPERIQAALYQTFDIQLLYRKDMHQVTIWATITDSTPHAVAEIMTDAGHDPAPASTSTGLRQSRRFSFGTPRYLTRKLHDH